MAGITLASIGDTAQAHIVVHELEQNFPSNTMLNDYWLPVIRAYNELFSNRPAAAVAQLEKTAPYDLAFPLPQFTAGGTMYPVYVRGLAYLAMHKGAEAAAEFQKFIDHRTVVVNFPLGSLARLQLGRALTMSGEATKARAAYDEFFKLWKDADADLPILKEAKAEYARLR